MLFCLSLLERDVRRGRSRNLAASRRGESPEQVGDVGCRRRGLRVGVGPVQPISSLGPGG